MNAMNEMSGKIHNLSLFVSCIISYESLSKSSFGIKITKLYIKAQDMQNM